MGCAANLGGVFARCKLLQNIALDIQQVGLLYQPDQHANLARIIRKGYQQVCDMGEGFAWERPAQHNRACRLFRRAVFQSDFKFIARRE